MFPLCFRQPGRAPGRSARSCDLTRRCGAPFGAGLRAACRLLLHDRMKRIFLIGLTVLLYFTNKKIWAPHKGKATGKHV